MAAERLSMRKLRELLRQRLELKLSVREIARSLGIGVGTVNRYLYRAQVAKLTSWPLPPELDDDVALTALLFADEGKVVQSRPEPDWAHVHAELRREGVTKHLLWQENGRRSLQRRGRARRRNLRQRQQGRARAGGVSAHRGSTGRDCCAAFSRWTCAPALGVEAGALWPPRHGRPPS